MIPSGIRFSLLFMAILAFLPARAHAQPGASIVNFDASTARMEEGKTYATAERNPEVATKSEIRLNFDPEHSLFGKTVPICGGIDIIESGETLQPEMFFLRVHTNNPPGWPGYPLAFFQATDAAGGAMTFNIHALFVWKKADFSGVKNGDTVRFDSTSSLSLNLKQWWAVEGGLPAELRFVIRNGTRYYVSEAKFHADTAMIGPDMETSNVKFNLDDFNNNRTPGKRWSVFDPSATKFEIPVVTDWDAVDFKDVTAVGWIGQGSGKFNRLFGFDTFSATGIVAPGMGK